MELWRWHQKPSAKKLSLFPASQIVNIVIGISKPWVWISSLSHVSNSTSEEGTLATFTPQANHSAQEWIHENKQCSNALGMVSHLGKPSCTPIPLCLSTNMKKPTKGRINHLSLSSISRSNSNLPGTVCPFLFCFLLNLWKQYLYKLFWCEHRKHFYGFIGSTCVQRSTCPRNN